MVEKKEFIPNKDYLTKHAVEKRETPIEVRYPDRRITLEIDKKEYDRIMKEQKDRKKKGNKNI